ncbi:MAG TPA: DUF202 domain-containing protein [Chloroflexota bacterium]|jgi:putative membrane protein
MATDVPGRDLPPVAAPPLNVGNHFAWLRTRMAVERTLMAWNRTSLSLISFGFTISQFFDKLQQATLGPNAPHPEAPRNLGLSLIFVGTVGTLIMTWQYVSMVRYLRRDEFKDIGVREGMPHAGLTLGVAIFSALIGIVTLGWILVRG